MNGNYDSSKRVFALRRKSNSFNSKSAKFTSVLLILVLFTISILLFFFEPFSLDHSVDFHYFDRQRIISLKAILENMAPNFNDSNAKAGSILASPSRRDPDYYYHWIRDGSVVMRSLLDEPSIEPAQIKSLFSNFADLSLKHQANSRGNLGEPKFMVDGSVFTGPWGRPQNDGPALRVLAFAAYIKQYGLDSVSSGWYRAEYPSNSLIKADLEFIVNQWYNQCFDLWEEVRATHFYTRITQQAALQAGVEIAILFNDPKAAQYYAQIASTIEKEMSKFWDESNNFLHYAIDIAPDQVHGKYSNLDTSVILGCLHAHDFRDPHYDCTSDFTMSTVLKIVDSFSSLYPISSGSKYPLLGRYPEDVYDGVGMSIGNPWILTTHAFAEYLYTIAAEIKSQKQYNVTEAGLDFFNKIVPGVLNKAGPLYEDKNYLIGNLTLVGDGYMFHVYKYAKNGAFSEQINRNTGQLQGARQLTWSHSSFLTALQVRSSLY